MALASRNSHALLFRTLKLPSIRLLAGHARSAQVAGPKITLHFLRPYLSASALTVPVNKKFKRTIVLRLTVLSKNGTTTERKRNGHAIRKQNGTVKKTERNVLRTVHMRGVTNISEADF